MDTNQLHSNEDEILKLYDIRYFLVIKCLSCPLYVSNGLSMPPFRNLIILNYCNHFYLRKS